MQRRELERLRGREVVRALDETDPRQLSALLGPHCMDMFASGMPT